MRNAHRWLVPAVVAAALGFGASQALAAPRQPEQPGTCNPGHCQVSCRAMGAVRGECHDGQCLCLFVSH